MDSLGVGGGGGGGGGGVYPAICSLIYDHIFITSHV